MSFLNTILKLSSRGISGNLFDLTKRLSYNFSLYNANNGWPGTTNLGQTTVTRNGKTYTYNTADLVHNHWTKDNNGNWYKKGEYGEIILGDGRVMSADGSLLIGKWDGLTYKGYTPLAGFDPAKAVNYHYNGTTVTKPEDKKGNNNNNNKENGAAQAGAQGGAGMSTKKTNKRRSTRTAVPLDPWSAKFSTPELRRQLQEDFFKAGYITKEGNVDKYGNWDGKFGKRMLTALALHGNDYLSHLDTVKQNLTWTDSRLAEGNKLKSAYEGMQKGPVADLAQEGKWGLLNVNGLNIINTNALYTGDRTGLKYRHAVMDAIKNGTEYGVMDPNTGKMVKVNKWNLNLYKYLFDKKAGKSYDRTMQNGAGYSSTGNANLDAIRNAFLNGAGSINGSSVGNNGQLWNTQRDIDAAKTKWDDYNSATQAGLKTDNWGKPVTPPANNTTTQPVTPPSGTTTPSSGTTNTNGSTTTTGPVSDFKMDYKLGNTQFPKFEVTMPKIDWGAYRTGK